MGILNLTSLWVLLKGLATCLPGYQRLLDRLGLSCPGGTVTASYCYSVWRRHLNQARQNGLTACPEVVAEIGPGNSLGVGICALLDGARSYVAFDLQNYARRERNLQIFEELVEMVRRDRKGTPGPGAAETGGNPGKPPFPPLSPERLAAIRNCLLHVNRTVGGLHLGYVAPWDRNAGSYRNSVDFLLSQAVMEHVEDIHQMYRWQYEWLKPGGMISHVIDYRCHQVAREWNGHWAYPESLWKLMRSRRPYFINRQPHSAPLAAIEACGFRIVTAIRYPEKGGISRQQLAAPFQDLSEEDLTTGEGFIQAVKPCP